jgi:hypothetical protein
LLDLVREALAGFFPAPDPPDDITLLILKRTDSA